MYQTLVSIAVLTCSFLAIVSAQVTGFSSVHCISGWEWANNTLQSPHICEHNVEMGHARWIHFRKDMATSAQQMIPQPRILLYLPLLPRGICSTPLYILVSACGACQNRTYISWTAWSQFCPTNIIPPEGQYDAIIPAGTRVPAYVFLKPSYYGDYFNPAAARQLGDFPESTHVFPTTTMTSSAWSTTDTRYTTVTWSTTSTDPSSTSSRGSGGGKGSNLGAIVGGVLGGVLGLGSLILLGFWIIRHQNGSALTGSSYMYAAQRPTSFPEMAAASHGGGPGYIPTQHPGGYGQRNHDPRAVASTSPTHSPPSYSDRPEF
ncbi:hypothetical protein DL93DRAFT_2102835 [Clavulina sp. PMI_390]|nr:hypothetical protein DL93DRAFT_2102835 [Clavulina sp. PMI_390]